MKKIIYILLVGIFTSVAVQAAKIKHFSQENGLSSNRSYSIVQDDMGFMWIGTKNGIDRFDGRSFKTYELINTIDGNADLTGRINKTKKDSDGNIWAYSNFGAVFLYDERSDMFILKLNLLDFFSGMLPYINGIYPLDTNRFFVFGTFGLYYYNAAEAKLVEVEKYRQRNVRIFEHIENSVYAVGAGDTFSVSEIMVNGGNVTENILHSIQSEERMQCLSRNPYNNSLLIGTNSGKLLSYDLENNSLASHDFNIKGPIRNIIVHGNYYYLCTESSGVRYLPVNFLSNGAEMHSLNEDVNLGEKSINQLFIEDNKFWVVTFNKGIYLIDYSLPEFSYVEFPKGQELHWGGFVNSVLEDKDGCIRMGTENGIVSHNTVTNKWQYFSLHSGSLDINRFYTLAISEDVNGDLWAGGILASKFVCIDKNGKIKKVHSLPIGKQSTQSGRVYCIYNDPVSRDLFIGGTQSLLSRLSLEKDSLINYNINYVNCIRRNNAALLIGTANGLLSFDEIKGSATPIELSTRATPVSQYINVIHTDNRDNIWVGTEGGLFLLNREHRVVKSYTKQSGLPSNCIYGILTDSRNRVWLSSDLSLSCLDPATGDIINFSVEEGMTASQFFPRSAYKMRNGDFIFGTINGYIRFSPEKIDRVQTLSRLVFTDFMLDYRRISPESHGVPLKDLINNIEKLELKYNQNTFSISFSSINYTNPGSEKFVWKLDGYDDNWIDDDLSHTARYSNVPTGKYTFHVRLLNKDTGTVIKEKSVTVVVKPPFWATIWALLIYLVVIMFIAGYIIKILKARQEKRATDDKIQFFTNTAHELKTPITLVKGPLAKLEEISTGGDKEKRLIHMALSNTIKLYDTVTQLLDFEKIDIKGVKLYLEPKDITEYLSEQVELFGQMAEKKSISLKLMTNVAPLTVWMDEEKMDKIIANLLSNAIKYTPSDGRIDIVLKADEKHWTLEVNDTGIGIPARFHKDMFKPFKRADNVSSTREPGTGLGLMITKKLIALHNGSISFKSNLNRGTSFVVSLPKHYSLIDKNNYILASSSNVSEHGTENESISPTGEKEKKKILVVEDNADVREFISYILSEKYTIIEAEDGIAGLEKVKSIKPELVISDIMMPRMDGYELCHLIKADKNTSHIPVILLTALSGQNHQLKGYQLGADNYIAKPFDNQILLFSVENTIATREALRNNILPMLSVDTANEDIETNPLDKKFIDEIVGIVEKHINDPGFSIDKLCWEMTMSRSSLYNKLKLLTNQSPNEFIRFIRLNKAAKILHEGDYDSIAEVSYAVGIGDEKYFSTAFKKQFGVSPSKYK